MHPRMHVNMWGAFTLSEVAGSPLDALRLLGVNGTTLNVTMYRWLHLVAIP